MAFDGRSGTYLTVMPLADLKAQAFIRTWPASEIRRPGSVWSHVLLLDFVDLGHLDKAGSLLRLFKPPADDWLSQEDWKSRYGHPLEVSLDANGVPYTTTTELELSLRVLEAVYSSDGPVSVVAGDIDEAERVLIAMFEQQWPRLRRSFAFRTRARSSSTPEGFDVEIVERSKAAAAVPHSIGSWIQVLALDLMRPDPEFRTLLRLFGPESENGRADIPGLVSVLAAVREGNNAAKVLDELCRLFPAPKSMGRLKRTLYGPIEDSAPTLQGWPHEDESRLGLILKSGGVCLDFGDLDVQGRLRRAWTERPANTIHAVAGTATNLKEKHLKSVLSVTAAEAPATYLAKLVDQRGDLGRMMLQHKPSLIRSPELWALESFRPHLLESLHQREKQDQVATLIALIDANEREAAAEVCTVDSSLWWDTFFYSARSSRRIDARFENRAEALNRLSAKIGMEALGSPRERISGDFQLALLALASSPGRDLWKRAKPDDWISLAERFTAGNSSVQQKASRDIASRVEALSLRAATDSHSSRLRRRAWLNAFSNLHEALVSRELNRETWSALEEWLPGDRDLDPPHRLRSGAVEAIVRDRWPREDVEELFSAVPEYRAELSGALQASLEERKKGRGWLRGAIEDLLP